MSSERWLGKRWKISSVAHPRNNLFGEPEATKPCGNCLQSLTKLQATPPRSRPPPFSSGPALFTSVHFLFLLLLLLPPPSPPPSLSLLFLSSSESTIREARPLSNAFKFEIQTVYLAAPYLARLTFSPRTTYQRHHTYAVQRNSSFPCSFSFAYHNCYYREIIWNREF